MQTFRAPSNDQSIFAARAPQGNALMSAGAATRTGSRAKEANGSCIVPVIVPIQIQSSNPTHALAKSMYPVWQKRDGLAYGSAAASSYSPLLTGDPVEDPGRDRGGISSADVAKGVAKAKKDYVFYGMCVGISPHGPNRLGGRNQSPDYKRYDICVRGVYDAPHNWLWTWADSSRNELVPYAFNCGVLLMDLEQNIIFVQGLHKAIEDNDVILGRFYNHVTDWSLFKRGVTRTLVSHRNICRRPPMTSAAAHGRALTPRERRANKRTFKVFLRT